MKNLIYKISLLCAASALFAACTNDSQEINTNPTTVYEINPNNHFYKACEIMNNSSFEFYYDYCAGHLLWMQYTVGTSGNTATSFDYTSNMGDRYSRFVSAGGYVKDLEEYIKSHMTESDQSKYHDLIAISRILLIYYGIYASDTYGSLVYDEGWQARYGGISEPAFQVQENLYNEWEQQLKDAITTLKQTNSTQVPIGEFDPVYNGNVQKWIKAANALRLRMATRWTKRDMNKAKSIASDVLSSSDIFSSNSDGWIFYFDGSFTGHDNFGNIANYRATYSMINFLSNNNDPRLHLFYRKNYYDPDVVALWNDQNPSNQLVYSPQQYVGGHAIVDGKSKDTTPEYYATARKVKLADGTEITLDTISRVQERLFYPQFSSGTGISWMPGVTYADFCFMAAEFTQLGATSSKSAQQWYEDGVRSSIMLYSDLARRSDIFNYQPVTDEEITSYLQTPAAAWDASKALEKIYCQAFINFFKNSNEAWSLWKRTGYPNTTSVLSVEPLIATGNLVEIPRRQPLTYPIPGTVNYDNYKKRIDDMKADPDYGDPGDATGHIWWDKK